MYVYRTCISGSIVDSAINIKHIGPLLAIQKYNE